MGDSGGSGKCFCLIIIILMIIVGLILGIYFGVKNSNNKVVEKTFEITEEHVSRVSLLQQCMNEYGVTNIPELKEENYNATVVTSNKVLSMNKIEIKGNKGETVQLFKYSLELGDDEYMCISYKINDQQYVTKVNYGRFTIPNDLNTDINNTEFTLILYFNYDPSINEYTSTSVENLKKTKYNTSLVLYNKNKSITLRNLNLFSFISDFFESNIESIVEKVVEKVVSTICVALVKYLCQDYSNIIVKSIGEFACDELGELAGEGVTKLIFNSDSKPAENYREITYEEIEKNNFTQLPSSEAEYLRKTVTGTSKDLNKLIKLITNKTSEERQRMKKSYNSFYGDLIKDLKNELSGDFEDAVLALFYHPVEYDFYWLKDAIYWLGTNEDTLIEIICNRNNTVIGEIKQRYFELLSGIDLIEDVIGDTSGNFKKTLVALLEEKRANNTEANIEDCENSANLLFTTSIQKKVVADVFIKIFTEKSQADFILIEELFYALADKTLLEVVEKEFSGDLKDGLVGIYYSLINPAMYYAKKVHKSLEGIGTDENTLTRILVTRYEVDMPLINEVYQKLYDTDMVNDIIGDTSGNYQTLMATLASSGNYSLYSDYLELYINKIFIFIILSLF